MCITRPDWPANVELFFAFSRPSSILAEGWPSSAGRACGRDRDPRDLTVKGSRHLTFHITVKLTIKEEMLNLTCRQTFSFTQARPDSVWLKGGGARCGGSSATRGPCQHPGSRSSALRYYASAAQDMHSRACGVCMPEAVGVKSLRVPQGRA